MAVMLILAFGFGFALFVGPVRERYGAAGTRVFGFVAAFVFAFVGFAEGLVMRATNGAMEPAGWLLAILDAIIAAAAVGACVVVMQDRRLRPGAPMSLLDVGMGAMAFAGGAVLGAIGVFLGGVIVLVLLGAILGP